MLSATTILSQFFRTSVTVLAPELIVELKLTSKALGMANAIFFFALMAAQIPVGILFDRIGVRYTVGGLAVLGVVGSLLHAVVRDGSELIAARFDLVVANIQEDVLLALRPALAGRVAPGGRLMLSGLLAAQVEGVADAYAQTGLRILEQKGHLRHEKDGVRHVYHPTTPPEIAKRSALRHMIGTFFGGSRAAAVAALLDESERPLSPRERQEIDAVIRRLRREGR